MGVVDTFGQYPLITCLASVVAALLVVRIGKVITERHKISVRKIVLRENLISVNFTVRYVLCTTYYLITLDVKKCF